MDQNTAELSAKVDSMDARLTHLEAANKQLAELLAGLAQVTQQLMEANSVILEVAQKVQGKKK